MKQKKTIVQILGPTGVGKSRVAFQLALELQGEIVSADSMQVYQDFDIGTDKIGSKERDLVTHHLIDIFSECSQFNGAIFLRMAGQAVNQIITSQKIPIVCGGTALYLSLMIKGIFPETHTDPKTRKRLKNIADRGGFDLLWSWLKKVDPAYAARINQMDKVRVTRALEIYYNNQQPPSQVFLKTVSPFKDYKFIRIGLQRNRQELYQRINERIDKMIVSGLVEEVKSLLKKYPKSCPPFKSLGYKEILLFLEKKMDFDETIAKIKQHSRNFAKRQLTWFRKEQDIKWFDATNYPGILSYIKSNLQV